MNTMTAGTKIVPPRNSGGAICYNCGMYLNIVEEYVAVGPVIPEGERILVVEAHDCAYTLREK